MESKKSNGQDLENLKSHFGSAQVELKGIQGPTMQPAGYHHANMLAQQLRDDLTNQQTEMLAMMQNLMVPKNRSTTRSECSSK